MLIFSSVIKLLDMKMVQDTMSGLGWPIAFDRMIGVIELLCVVLYLAPRTSMIGAILMTGLLGGAVAAHVRVGSPLFSHVLFGVYLGLFAWGGLYLRDSRLRALIPLKMREGPSSAAGSGFSARPLSARPPQ
jgi:hypothetical protein